MDRLPAELNKTTISMNTASLLDPTVDFTEVSMLETRGGVLHGKPGSGPLSHTAYIPDEPLTDLNWNARYRIEKHLGRGGQGAVYLANREGADGYTTKVAAKVYYRHPKVPMDVYVTEMRRVARQGQHVSHIQHDNLINVRDFVAIGETRIMILEWIDGLDLAVLLDLDNFRAAQKRMTRAMSARLHDVVVTEGPDQCCVKPGVVVNILRGCLAGLSALHQYGVAHCDLKPANIMLKRAGIKKIVDIDSSCVVSEDSQALRGTPYYMAPEQLQRKAVKLTSDIASLGYVLIEMLTGKLLFRHCTNVEDLLRAKLELPTVLDGILPAEVRSDPVLHELAHKMIAIHPEERLPDARVADFDEVGAASFHRHLARANISTEYSRELAWWVGALSDSQGFDGNP